MLGESCLTHLIPMMRDRKKNIVCVGCDEGKKTSETTKKTDSNLTTFPLNQNISKKVE